MFATPAAAAAGSTFHIEDIERVVLRESYQYGLTYYDAAIECFQYVVVET